jgi:hypothetical protein
MTRKSRSDYNNQELGTTKGRRTFSSQRTKEITRELHSCSTHFKTEVRQVGSLTIPPFFVRLGALKPKVRLWLIFLLVV